MTALSLAFLVVLWLFVGSLIMLAVNDLTPGGITEAEFVRGMIIWPWMTVCFIWQFLRLLILGMQ